MSTDYQYSQVLIIGSGLSACTTALVLADLGKQVSIVTPTDILDGGNSVMAQGGIVYIDKTDNKDSEKKFERDMHIAGHHYNYSDAVHFLATDGSKVLEKLLIDRLQVPFDQKSSTAGDWGFTLEGGHSHPRILHCADHTGKTIMTAIHAAVKQHPNIEIFTNRAAIDLITTEHSITDPKYRYLLENQCIGAFLYNQESAQVECHCADITVLATGGVGQLYLHSTNGPWSIGSGISMAQRASVRLTNMEFVQFHPTALYSKSRKRSLITEAVRGEGAVIVDENGTPFMKNYDKRADLAPRDIVSQAISEELLKTGNPHVYLDATKLHCDVTQRFPTVYKSCMDVGIDIRKDLIPVVPAAHYFCGGILVDLQGKSTLNRLYAVGECSCTGIHGANRLASTSLLEAVLWGDSAAQDINKNLEDKNFLKKELFKSIAVWQSTGNEHNDDPALIAQDWTSIHNIMWNYVGILRTESRLHRAFADLRDLSSHLHDFYRRTPITMPLLSLFHGCQTAYLITQAAMRSPKSVGCHHKKAEC